jgi:hypothetical protein
MHPEDFYARKDNTSIVMVSSVELGNGHHVRTCDMKQIVRRSIIRRILQSENKVYFPIHANHHYQITLVVVN